MDARLLFILIFLLIHNSLSQEDDDEVIAVELQMADFDLSDSYDEISETTKAAFLGSHGFEDRIIAEKERGRLMREQAEKNVKFEGSVSYTLDRNWTLLTKPGDLLLPENELNSLINFHNNNEELAKQAKVSCLNNANDCVINGQEMINILATNRNVTYLNKTWSSWQNVFERYKDQYKTNLEIVNKAFIANEQHSPRSYWEVLCEYEDGYARAQTLWNEIEPFYKKLHSFVKVRLFEYYKINRNQSTIPVYLLGENFGIDWTNVAEMILPHPYLYYEVETELKYHTTKDIYVLAENVTKTMGLGLMGKEFWNKSNFNFTKCGQNIFTNCGQEFSEVITCDKKLSWKEYFDIHEAAFDVALRNQDYASLPRQELRFSATDEALKSLSSIIAIEKLPDYEFIPAGSFLDGQNEHHRKETALLLLALRILPRLPYYLLADTWRVEELEFSYGNFTEQWWLKRKEIQGVHSNTNLETDFLGDSFIVSNKPYLSKFLGIFLQFQLVDYYKKFFGSENGTTTSFIKRDENFKKFIFERPTKTWLENVDYQFGFGDISSTALLEYFKPLDDYMNNAPLKQVIISTTAKPRTTRSTNKPTKRKTKSHRKLGSTSIEKNETSLVQNDQEQLSNNKNNTNDIKVGPTAEDDSTKTSKGKIGVIIGVLGVICVGAVLIIVVKKLRKRKKQGTNNRRFET